MASLGWAGSQSQGYNGLGAEASAQRGIFRKDRALPTTMRAQAPTPIARRPSMRFYKQPLEEQPHRFYCGVDLHARCMYLCILDAAGQTVLHQDYPADAGAFLDAVAPYRDGLAV